MLFFIFLPHYGNEERADLTTEQPDELHFHGLSRLLVTSHCLFSFSVHLVKNCDNKKRLLLLHPKNFKGEILKKTRSRTQERIQKILAGWE